MTTANAAKVGISKQRVLILGRPFDYEQLKKMANSQLQESKPHHGNKKANTILVCHDVNEVHRIWNYEKKPFDLVLIAADYRSGLYRTICAILKEMGYSQEQVVHINWLDALPYF